LEMSKYNASEHYNSDDEQENVQPLRSSSILSGTDL
jgi:hypothetical protein